MLIWILVVAVIVILTLTIRLNRHRNYTAFQEPVTEGMLIGVKRPRRLIGTEKTYTRAIKRERSDVTDKETSYDDKLSQAWAEERSQVQALNAGLSD